MDTKFNSRLKEIKLGIHINHIDKSPDLVIYKHLLKLLSCVAVSLSVEANKRFSEIAQMSICDGFVRATDKELCATIHTFFTKAEAIKKLKTTRPTFNKRYSALDDENYITNDYLNSLKPTFDDDISKAMITVINKFIDEMKIPRNYAPNNNLENKERTLEIDFMLIYDKLMDIFENVAFVDAFLENICNAFNIDYATIFALKSNMHVINRTYPRFRYNNIYLMQEIYTLFTKRGYKKGTIGSKILGKQRGFMFSRSSKNYTKLIKEEDLGWQYTPALDWSNLSKSAVLRFIDVLKLFSEYDV